MEFRFHSHRWMYRSVKNKTITVEIKMEGVRNMDKLKLSAYEIIEVRKIADIESMGYILRHKKKRSTRVCHFQ